ncbi:MAG: ribosome silencing factor [Bacteroidetes bacterium]|nr:ribosome silencing factor [Bacteroidota bacterium]
MLKIKDLKLEPRGFAPERLEDKKRKTHAPVKLITRLAVDAILEKKGRNIEVLDVRIVSGVADFFVIATGDSELQVKAIVASVRANLKEKAGERPWHVEGKEHHNWVLMDYVDLVVHVFLREQREYYSLERLWGDAPHATVDEMGSAADVKILKD